MFLKFSCMEEQHVGNLISQGKKIQLIDQMTHANGCNCWSLILHGACGNMVEAKSYKLEGCGPNSRGDYWNFQLT